MTSNGSIAARLHDLRHRVVDGPGELASSVRRAAGFGADVPEEAQAYREKVRLHAYKVVDRDVDDLRAAGWSEDQIFELTIATALEAGLSRFERVSRLLEEARD